MPLTGRPHTLARPFRWPDGNETITVAEAIPKWMRTTGCTWDEAVARVGVSYRTAERWMQQGGLTFRQIADGADPEAFGETVRLVADFYAEVCVAAAEVVVRWQAILEREGRGGFPIERRTVVAKHDAAGNIIERTETVTTEIARPNVAVIQWKMRKQIDRYREKSLPVSAMEAPVDMPPMSDAERAAAAVTSIREWQATRHQDAIEASASDGLHHVPFAVVPRLARRILPPEVDDPFEDLRRLVFAMDPDEVAWWLTDVDPEIRQMVERMMAADAATGVRAHPSALAHYLLGDSWNRWPYVELLSQRFADLIRGVRPRQLWKLPSQYGKTTMCSRVGPIWALDLDPTLRIMYVSYDADKAVEEAGDTRDLVIEKSADLNFDLRPDRRARGMWRTDQGGWFYATGIGGAITGFPADEVIGDDVIKGWQAAHSEANRQLAWNVFRSQMRLRIQKPTDGILLAGTCWHEDDVLARASKLGGVDLFDDLRLPAIAESDDDPLGRQPGDVLEPERFPPAEVHARQAILGEYLWAAMEQQRPAPEEGTDLKRDWFRVESALPVRYDQIATSWDMKLKEKEQGDYVVGLVIGRVGGDFWIREMYRGQWNQATTRAAMALAIVRWPRASAHYYENAGYGPEVAEQLRRGQPDYAISDDVAGAIGCLAYEREPVERIMRRGISALIPVTPKGDKRVRARAISPIAEAGNVHLDAGLVGLETFLAEMTSFPNGAHDDIVDAWSQGLTKMSRGAIDIATPSAAVPRIQRPDPTSLIARLTARR